MSVRSWKKLHEPPSIEPQVLLWAVTLSSAQLRGVTGTLRASSDTTAQLCLWHLLAERLGHQTLHAGLTLAALNH